MSSTDELEHKGIAKVSAERIKKWKYECKVRIQLCAILSQLNKHEAAQYHARKAVKYADSFVYETFKVCGEHLKRHKKLLNSGRLKSKVMERPQYKLMESPHYQQFHEAVLKNYPILESLAQRLGTKKPQGGLPAKPPKLDMRSVLGVQHYNDWIYSYNIGDVMVIEPLEMADLKSNFGLQIELTKDMMFEKICVLAVAYFCVATEIRFLCSQQGPNAAKEREGEIWHAKAVTIVKDFLPLECPLGNHIKQSFTRNYGRSELNMSSGSTKKVREGRTSIRPQTKNFEASIGGRRTPHQEPKSPLPGKAEEIVKQMLGRPRSTSGKNQKKSPTKKREDVSPKPKAVRPVTAHQPRRAAPNVVTKPKFEESPRVVTVDSESEEEEYMQDYLAKAELTRSVPSLGGENPIGVPESPERGPYRLPEVEAVRPEVTPKAPLHVREEQIEVLSQGEENSDDSYREEIVISSNELYGVNSDSEDYGSQEEDEEDLGRRSEEIDVPVPDLKKEKRFEQFRPISSTGGHN